MHGHKNIPSVNPLFAGIIYELTLFSTLGIFQDEENMAILQKIIYIPNSILKTNIVTKER